MVAQNFQVLAKLGFCLNCSQNFSGCSFARAARKANFYQCSCSQGKTLCSHARKDHSIPLARAPLASESSLCFHLGVNLQFERKITGTHVQCNCDCFS